MVSSPSLTLSPPVTHKTSGFYNISATQQVDWQSQSVYFAKPCRSTANVSLFSHRASRFPDCNSMAERQTLIQGILSRSVGIYRNKLLNNSFRRQNHPQEKKNGRTDCRWTVDITKGESSLRRQRQVSLWLGDWRRLERRKKNDSISVKDDFVNLHCHHIAVTELLWAFVRSSMRFIQTHTGWQTVIGKVRQS